MLAAAPRHCPLIHRVLSAVEAGAPRPERGPAPSYGGAAGRQCSQLPGDFQKDSVTPSVSSGLCLWEPLGSGAPVMSTHSHYLFLHCICSGHALQCGAPGSPPDHPLPSLHLSPLLSPPSSGFQSGISAACWPLKRNGTSGGYFLFFRGNRNPAALCLGSQDHGRAPWIILYGLAGSRTVTRGPCGWLCPPSPR